MNIDEITQFVYSRYPELQGRITKEMLKRCFEIHKDNIIEKRINGQLVGVGFYQRRGDELRFISATIREDINGVAIMLRALKEKAEELGVKFVSWKSLKRKFKKWRIRK